MWKFAPLALAATIVTAGTAPQAHAGHQEAALVESWYQRYLGRCADAPSLHAYAAQICRGTPAFEVEAQILGSDEYYHRNGCDVHLFIRALYRDVLGAGTYQNDIEEWCRRLRRMDNRTELARRFIIETRGRAPVAAVSNYAPVAQPVYVQQPVVQQPVIVQQPEYVNPPVTVVQPAPILVAPPHHHHHHRPGYYAPAPIRPGVSVNVRFPL
jgi:hypothetical protein